MSKKRWLACVGGCVLAAMSFGDMGEAQAQGGKRPTAIFLEDEKIDVKADLPGVELLLSFKGLKYSSLKEPESFIPELLETVEKDPF